MLLSDHDVLVIKPRKGLSPIDFKALWEFRDLLFAFAGRDIRLRYRQTALGVGWVLLQPLLGAGLFAIVFGLIAQMPADGTPYFLVTYAGLLGWTVFFGAITRIAPSLVANANLIKKIYFPRLLVPLGTLPSVLLDFAVSLGLLVVLLFVFGVLPNWGLLLAPLCVVILLTIALGIGLVATSLSVKYRDVQHVIPVATQLLLYASPVGYAASAVPAKYQMLYFLLNPLAAPIETIRWAFLNTTQPPLHYLAVSAALAGLSLVIGLIVFRATEREFADVI